MPLALKYVIRYIVIMKTVILISIIFIIGYVNIHIQINIQHANNFMRTDWCEF